MMNSQDAAAIKESIVQNLRILGASLPVKIASRVNQSLLFTSAFLSELMAEKRIKSSHMRVGSSPVYFIPGQEAQLENFIEHIKGKEKEALLSIKENKFLKDSEQIPAIKVALHSLKDFAIPFKTSDEIYWRYFLVPESEFLEKSSEKIQTPEFVPELKETRTPEVYEEPANKKPKAKKETAKKKTTKKLPAKKQDDKFFNRVKEFLESKQAEIIEIIYAGKAELILKIRLENREKILVAYNKKKIDEKDIIKAHKKAREFNLPYLIMSLGEMPKKTTELIEALKSLADIEKIE